MTYFWCQEKKIVVYWSHGKLLQGAKWDQREEGEYVCRRGNLTNTTVPHAMFSSVSPLHSENYESAIWNKFQASIRLSLKRQCNSFNWKIFTDIENSNLLNFILVIQCNILDSLPYTLNIKSRIRICRTSDKILTSDWSISLFNYVSQRNLYFSYFFLPTQNIISPWTDNLILKWDTQNLVIC